MALIIRLRKQGRTNRPFFRLVVTDSRTPRDGKYLEKLGWYNPKAETGKNLSVDTEKVKRWVNVGAQLSVNAQSLLAKTSPDVLKELIEKKKKKVTKKRLQRKKQKSKQK